MKRTAVATLTLVGAAILIAFMTSALPEGTLEPVVRAEPRSTLPSASSAKDLLNTTHRHREWITVPISRSESALAWVMYPERTDRAPVIVLSDGRPEPEDWTRAVSDQLAAEGYVVVVPDVLTEVDAQGNRRAAAPSVAANDAEVARRVDSVRQAVLALPAAQNTVVDVDLDRAAGRLRVRTPEREASFALTAESWPSLIDFLNRETDNLPSAVSAAAHADHLAMQTVQARAASGVSPLAIKDPRLPAGYYTARSVLMNMRLKSEWVDIPLEGSEVKLHTFIVYPATTQPTGVVLVMQHGVGLDEWQRALAVQVAEDGFIAVAPDLWSGTGPTGGNWDASEFIDDAQRAAAGKITPAETMRRYKVAREYALKLPQSNGKSGSMGFCAGGGNSFRFAAEVPEHNASVVFYGTAPSEEELAKIKAPVLGFYGENDARVTATVEPTKQAMARLGKQYEAHVYPKATHSFVLFQDIGNNPTAIADAWPRTIAFFRQQLSSR